MQAAGTASWQGTEHPHLIPMVTFTQPHEVQASEVPLQILAQFLKVSLWGVGRWSPTLHGADPEGPALLTSDCGQGSWLRNQGEGLLASAQPSGGVPPEPGWNRPHVFLCPLGDILLLKMKTSLN